MLVNHDSYFNDDLMCFTCTHRWTCPNAFVACVRGRVGFIAYRMCVRVCNSCGDSCDKAGYGVPRISCTLMALAVKVHADKLVLTSAVGLHRFIIF